MVKALRRLQEEPAAQDETGKMYMDILELLLRHRADPNKMYRGHNGFFQGVENGSPDILRLLLKYCPVPDLVSRDDQGMTVLEVAASRGWQEGRSILLQAQQAAEATNGNGNGNGSANGSNPALAAAKTAAAANGAGSRASMGASSTMAMR